MADRDTDDPGVDRGGTDPTADAPGGASRNGGGPGDEDGDDWRFEVDELDDDDADSSDVEAGSPNPEHVLFVLLGAVATILVFVRLWMLVG